MTENRINEVVDVTVSITEAPLSPAAFGRAMILGIHTRFAERFRLYTSLTGMTDDGFVASDAEYKAAEKLLAQSAISGKRVQDFLVGRRATAVANVWTGVVTYEASQNITITISRPGLAPVSVVVATDTDGPTTMAAIVAALNADSDLGPILTAAPVSGSTLTITSDQAGIQLSVSATGGGSAALALTETTANVGLKEDLTAVKAAGAEWFATIPTTRNAGDIKHGAEWHEADGEHIMLAQGSDSASKSAAYDSGSPYADVASELKAGGYNLTSWWYHGDDASDLAAAVAGRCLPNDPGTQTWAQKRLSGIVADDLTATEIANLTGTKTNPTGGKNANVYIAFSSSISLTQRGMMASGRYIDVQRTAMWLQNQVQTAVFNAQISREKVPFDDSGIQYLANAVRGVLAAAKDAGVLASDREFSVTPPRSADISAANKTARVLSPAITANAILSGALHYAQVSITLS